MCSRRGARCSRRSSGSRAARRRRSRRRTRGCPRPVLVAGRILRREPLVVVVVPVDDEVGAAAVERVPERPRPRRRCRARPELNRGWCQIASVHIGGRRLRGRPSSQRPWANPAAQPPTIEQSESRTITCHAPRSYEYQLVAVRRRPLPEIAEVPGEVLRLPVVVPGGGLGPVQVAAPGRVVAVAELVGAAVRVGVVAGGEDGPVDRVEERRRRRAGIERAVGDVAGPDEDRVARCRGSRGRRASRRAIAIAWLVTAGVGRVGAVAPSVAAAGAPRRPADEARRTRTAGSGSRRRRPTPSADGPGDRAGGPGGRGSSLIGKSLPRASLTVAMARSKRSEAALRSSRSKFPAAYATKSTSSVLTPCWRTPHIASRKSETTRISVSRARRSGRTAPS